MLVEKLSEIQNSHLKIRESIQFLEQSLSPQDYNDQTLLDDLYRNLEGLETPKIKLPIIGRVKAGKSTLLSAIMGPSSKAGFEDKPPLHIDTNEATAVVIDIEYGENVEVFLKKMNPDGNYDEKVIDYERYLEDYKVSIDAEENRRKFKNVIGFCVKYPNELLKSGLILQDLPGLEMHDERTEISLKVIRNSSFGVFVFNKHFTKDQDAASIFQEFRKENCRIITVFNDFGFDLRREQGRESKRIVVQQFYKLITGNTCIIKTIEEADEIIKELEEQYETFFVSAKSAWEGKLEGDQQEIISSGILKLEQLLATLVGDEMKEKIKTDAEQRIFVRLKARKVQLQEQIEQLNRSKTASEGRVIAQQKNVANRQEEYDKAKALIIDHRDQTKKELKESFSNFIDRLVTMIVNYGYTFSGDILDKITLANRLNKVIGDELNHWENSEVSIIIQRYKALLNSELEIVRSQYDVKETGSNLLENNSNNFREDAWEKTTNSVKSLFTVKEDTVVNKVTIDNSEAISFGALGIAFAAMAILGVIFLPLFTVLLPKLGFFIFTGKRVLQDLDNITYRVKSKANSKLTEARLKTGEKIDEIVNKQYNEVFIALDNYIAVIAEETKIVVFVAEEEAKKQKTIEASIKTSQAKEESLDNCINDITSILN